MNVSYPMVRRLCSDARSTALRQHGKYQTRLTTKDQAPLLKLGPVRSWRWVYLGVYHTHCFSQWYKGLNIRS